MRLFENSAVYNSYRPRLGRLTQGAPTFDAAIDIFFNDRFGASHFLDPVLKRRPETFFANGDDETSQRLWAKETGLADDVALEQILLAQVEEHKTEVFYNHDPMRYGDIFLKRLPGSVKRTVAWRAAPSAGGQFLTHDVIVNNFPFLLEGYRAQGVRAEILFPAHDPELDAYAERQDRPVDILFVGTYSRHHRTRVTMLETIARLRSRMNVVMHLDISRFTRLAESPLGWVGPLRKDRRSRDIRAISRPPLFGRDLLNAIGEAKIVVNGAIDMAGPDRGNMRIWEALGSGAALVSDKGNYPPGMEEGQHFHSYGDADELAATLKMLMADPATRLSTAAQGRDLIRTRYSKDAQ